MGRIVVTEFISLDGVIEDPGGSEDFRYGGWSFEFDRGDEGDKFKLDETRQSEALLLGRVTYQGFADAWPSREGEFADKFNTMPKYVVSSTLQDPAWKNSTVLTGDDVMAQVAKLRQDLSGDIVVHGSARLVQALVEHDLVHGVRVGGATISAPASAMVAVTWVASSTSKATRRWPATRRPTSTRSMYAAYSGLASSSVATPASRMVTRPPSSSGEEYEARSGRPRTSR